MENNKKQQSKQQKKNDYRIKVYKMILKQIQKIKLFTIKKNIRKIKQNQERKLSKSQESQQRIIEKLSKRQKNLENKMQFLKSLSASDIKIIAMYFFCYHFKIDPSIQNGFFLKEIGENYKEKIEDLRSEIEEEKSEKEQLKVLLVNEIKTTKQFNKSSVQIQQIVDYVQKNIQKSSLKRKIKKEKFRLKQQQQTIVKNSSQTDEVLQNLSLKKQNQLKGDDATILNSQQSHEINIQDRYPHSDKKDCKDAQNQKLQLSSQYDSQRKKSHKENEDITLSEDNEPLNKHKTEKVLMSKSKKIQKNYSQIQKSIGEDKSKLVKKYGSQQTRSQFKKTGRNRLKVFKQYSNQQKGSQIEPKLDVQNKDNRFFQRNIHPSWQAKIEIRQKEKNQLNSFQGTIKKL